jgi:hypothetical protein
MALAGCSEPPTDVGKPALIISQIMVSRGSGSRAVEGRLGHQAEALGGREEDSSRAQLLATVPPVPCRGRWDDLLLGS